MRTLAMLKKTEPRSLTSSRERLIKIGAGGGRQGRYVTFQTAEVAVLQQIFVDPDADCPAVGAARTGMKGRRAHATDEEARCTLIT